jgi:hypothetical protein
MDILSFTLFLLSPFQAGTSFDTQYLMERWNKAKQTFSASCLPRA